MDVRCSVCRSPDLAEVNRALVKEHVSVRDAASRFGFSPAAMGRHRSGPRRPHFVVTIVGWSTRRKAC